MDALCKCMFIIIETILNRAWRLCFKGHLCFSKNLFMSIFHIKKKYQVLLLLFLCTEQFTDTNLFTFSLQDRAALLLNMQNVHSLYYLLLHLFPSLCHTLYSDAAKFSIKLFSFIYLTVSVVRQRIEYKIVIETWPIKTSLHNQLSLPRC